MILDARAKGPRDIAGYDPARDAGECRFDPTAAARAVGFFYECLVHVKGAKAGQNFKLEEWQRDIVACLFGWKRPDGTRRYRQAYIFIPRKNGKALSVNTPLPTPTGWTDMGSVKVGDALIDEAGNPCRVTSVSGILYNRPCYRVSFSDGSHIVADAEHLWTVTSRSSIGLDATVKFPKGGGVVTATTVKLRETLTYGGRGDRNHSVQVAAPLALPSVDLPLPPYALGLWLGDGDSGSGRITCSYEDQHDLMASLEKGGQVSVSRQFASSPTPTILLGHGIRGKRKNNPTTALRLMGVLGNKHIPEVYLRGSVKQRTELLRGLMDSDGYASKAGQCEFTTTSRALRDGVHELLCSLGYKPTEKIARATLNGRDCGTKYRIQFWSYSDNPCFTLTRKNARLKQRPASATRTGTRQIIAIDPVESVPVQCVQVDSPSRLFLAGRSMIPTHNSTLAAGISLYTLFCDKEAGAECYCAASDKDQAGLVYSMAASMVRKCPPLAKRCKVRDSVKRIIFGDSFLRAIPANEGGAHGFNVHFLCGDELHAWEGARGREFRDVLHTGTGARSQPLECYITTAGYDRNSVCYEVDRYAKQVRDGQINDPAFLPAYYSADESDDWQSPEVWAKANPNLGVSVSLDYIAAECEKAKRNPQYENTFRRLHLNQWTSQEVRWLPMDKWRACQWTSDDFDLSKPVYGGLDLSQTCDLTAWVLLQEVDGVLRVRPHYFMPGGRVQEYERRDGVPYSQWIKEGRITAPPGEAINYEHVHRRIVADKAKYQLEYIGFDPYNATQTTVYLEGEGLQMVTIRQGATSLSAPMKDLERRVAEGTLDHGNCPVLEWMAENVEVVVDSNANIRPVKSERTRSKKIDGIVGLVNGLAVLNQQADATSIYEQPGAMTW